MELDKLVLHNVLYFMQSFQITVGKTSFDLPRTMIARIHVEKMYEEQVYPLWYISAYVPLWLYQEMVKVPDDLHVTMDLQYTLSQDLDDSLMGNTQLISEVKGRFKAIIPYQTEIADVSMQTEVSKASGSYNTGYEFNEGAMIELTLYNEKAYKAGFDIYNAVLKNISPINAMNYMLSQTGIQKTLLSPPDNLKTYNEFYILPETGVKNILRIVDEYKLHKDGTIVFFDLHESFIVSKKMTCDAWRTNEHKRVYVITQSKFSETLSKFSGVYIDDKEKFSVVAINEDAFSVQMPDVTPLLKDQSNMLFLTISTSNAIMSLFTPNKEFQFTIDDTTASTYNGIYRLYSMTMECIPNGEYLNPSFVVTFRK